MSKDNKKGLGAIFLAITVFLLLSLSNMVLAQEETKSASEETIEAGTSSATIEEINQNIKDRIKKVATQSGSLAVTKRKIAFIGTIENIANETLTIKTKEDIKLASTSATTTYVRLPGNTNQKLSDISIGDYAIAMGYVNGSEVLETKRVILSTSSPTPTKKTSQAGIISYIELDEGVIHLEFKGEETSVEITKNTDLLLQDGAEKVEIDFSDLKKGQFVSALYIPLEDPDEFNHPKALTILATNIIKDVPEEPTATESGKVMSEYLENDQEIEPTNPPELGF